MKNPADERAVRSRRRILAATQALMVDSGVDAVTILAVAERAGVQRSTVYNHWPDRLSLVVDAIDDFARPPAGERPGDPVAPASPIERVRHATRSLAAALRGDWGSIAAGLAAAAERDPALAGAHRTFVQSRRAEVAALLSDAIEAGELDQGTDTEWATALLVGPLYYERLVMHRPMPDDEAAEHIDRVLSLLRRAA